MIRILINNNKQIKENPNQSNSVQVNISDNQIDKREKQINQKNQYKQQEIAKKTKSVETIQKKDMTKLVNDDLAIKVKEIQNLQELLNQQKSIIINEVNNIIELHNNGQQSQIHLKYNKNQEIEKLRNKMQMKLHQNFISVKYTGRIQICKENCLKKHKDRKYFKLNEECRAFLSNMKSNQIKNTDIEYMLLGEEELLDYAKQYQLKQKVIQENKQLYQIQDRIEIKLIENQYIQQEGQCEAIAFDKTGSIMVSNDIQQIKIWKFENGRLSLQSQLQKHSHHVKCLFIANLQITLSQVLQIS